MRPRETFERDFWMSSCSNVSLVEIFGCSQEQGGDESERASNSAQVIYLITSIVYCIDSLLIVKHGKQG
jgi:hypothetical protein